MQPKAFQVQTPLERASCWFVTSGIQDPTGGVARYYQTDLETNAPVSTEITGYAVSALVYAAGRTQSQVYLESALRAARFLVKTAWDQSARAFPFELGSPRKAYFFDTGIIVRGLLAAWRATKDDVWLDAARLGGLAMRDFLIGGQVQPILQLPSKLPLAHQPAWSRSPGCYQLKAAMAWNDLFGAIGETQFLENYEEALDRALRSAPEFLPDPLGPDRTMDRLHAFCYFLEGLLPVVERAAAREALETGIQTVSAYLREIEPEFVRSDVYAQLLRVRLFASALAGIRIDGNRAHEEATRMAAMQTFEMNPRRTGGFYFGRRGDALLPFINPVSTAFCVQALEMWSDFNAGTFDPDPALLI